MCTANDEQQGSADEKWTNQALIQGPQSLDAPGESTHAASNRDSGKAYDIVAQRGAPLLSDPLPDSWESGLVVECDGGSWEWKERQVLVSLCSQDGLDLDGENRTLCLSFFRVCLACACDCVWCVQGCVPSVCMEHGLDLDNDNEIRTEQALHSFQVFENIVFVRMRVRVRVCVQPHAQVMLHKRSSPLKS